MRVHVWNIAAFVAVHLGSPMSRPLVEFRGLPGTDFEGT
jgi:hypothetical protein